jgi:hypothetical protein
MSTAQPEGQPGHTGEWRRGKNPELLPTPSLTPDEFEDFTERLLSAHRHCSGSVRHITRVARWGRKGDKQDGIDFEGHYSDGKHVAWQCKRYDKLTDAQVRKFVKECTYEADEYYLTFSGEASRDARVEIAKHQNWHMLDQRELGQLLNDLPLHKRRQVLDETWDVPMRKLFLHMPGEDAFLPVGLLAKARQDTTDPLNNTGPLIGREQELEALTTALDREADWPPIVLVSGPGGRGKTRLLVEALQVQEARAPQVPVLCLAPGRVVDEGALRELPQTPATIVVDDAHRDRGSLESLLGYAKHVDGTQLVLGTRNTGRDQLRQLLTTSGFRRTQLEEIPLAPLSKPHSRELVTSLAGDLNLSFELREYLVEQAVDTPFIPVLTLNLARLGELDGQLALDEGLREQVLHRYQQMQTGELEGIAAPTVQRLLATYVALGPTNSGDTVLRDRIAEFCALTRTDHARLLKHLHDRGVLVTRSERIRVRPDLLADQLLESESAVGDYDTRFVEELWEAFGNPTNTSLVTTLSELDWRLTHQGRPSIIAPVWTALRDELLGTGLEELDSALQKLEPLTFTQSQPFIALLQELHTRLRSVANTEDQDPSNSARAVDASSTQLRVRLGLQPLRAEDVERRLARLFGLCAAHAPEVLESALDALWTLARSDSREPYQHPDHPRRVVSDSLANLGELPDESFPVRIVRWVEQCLDEPTQEGDVITPIAFLSSLLAKQGERYVQVDRRQISIRPFAVSPAWAEPVRNATRDLLREQACGSDLRRAAAAVYLLGDALRGLRGFGGANIPPEGVVAWAQDDLKTVAVLQDAANAATSSVIRRMIRSQLSRTAEHASSAELRQAALQLLTELDERSDDLAEILLHLHPMDLPSRRGMTVPSVQELENPATAPQDRDWAERINGAERQTLLEHVVDGLWNGEDPTSAIKAIDACVREIRAIEPNRQLNLQSVLHRLAVTHGTHVLTMVQYVAKEQAGPLDEALPFLFGSWAEPDEASLLGWLQELSSQRQEVRLAVATAFSHFGWTDRGTQFVEVHRTGLHDSDGAVRQRFLSGSHRLLVHDAVTTVELLIQEGISTSAATRVLENASLQEDGTWGDRLDEAQATAILQLMSRANQGQWSLERLLGRIAHRHPRAVLGHLVSDPETRYRRTADDGHLSKAFEHHPEELAAWMVEQARTSPEESAQLAVHLAVGSELTDALASALIAASEGLESPALITLMSLLSDVPVWALSQPRLARYFLTRVQQDNELFEQMTQYLRHGMHLSMYGGIGGHSDELDATHARAHECAEAETHATLKGLYGEAVRIIEAQRRSLLRFDEEEED